ncbi:HNH endonuclease signature motif containing protein [Kribbella soli]|uniref:HNH endonuclease n=1 Tax=Kribbella soli TaxID=1124743 RepID=A0A4R0GZL2_9ACTN|nr:HNH endonuclease signature motif containing protein [Kribbella soli]TCC01322.1 HNH endonuclease [Kribbella soli]
MTTTNANPSLRAWKDLFMRRALREGLLVRPDACEICGKSTGENGKRLDAHHPNGYGAHALDVRWLCQSCHSRIHKRGLGTPGLARWSPLTYAGETLTLTEWAKRTGLATGTIVHRLDAGWSIEDALTILKDARRRP